MYKGLALSFVKEDLEQKGYFPVVRSYKDTMSYPLVLDIYKQVVLFTNPKDENIVEFCCWR